MKETIGVETLNFKVGQKHYSFDYKIWRNKEIVDEGSFDSRHSRSPQYIRKHLKEGWGTELVLEHKF